MGNWGSISPLGLSPSSTDVSLEIDSFSHFETGNSEQRFLSVSFQLQLTDASVSEENRKGSCGRKSFGLGTWKNLALNCGLIADKLLQAS